LPPGVAVLLRPDRRSRVENPKRKLHEVCRHGGSPDCRERAS
jgi:hypothetical protein